MKRTLYIPLLAFATAGMLLSGCKNSDDEEYFPGHPSWTSAPFALEICDSNGQNLLDTAYAQNICSQISIDCDGHHLDAAAPSYGDGAPGNSSYVLHCPVYVNNVAEVQLYAANYGASAESMSYAFTVNYGGRYESDRFEFNRTGWNQVSIRHNGTVIYNTDKVPTANNILDTKNPYRIVKR